MGKGRAKRPKPAVFKRNEAADLTQRLLRLYAADPEFQESLRRFAEEHEQVIWRLAQVEERSSGLGAFEKLRSWGTFWSLIESYHTATIEFAKRWRLDRFPDQLGIDALHRFCVGRFKSGLDFDALPQAITDIQDFNRAVLEDFGQPQGHPIAQPIEVYFQGDWPAWNEPQVEARKRLVSEFTALLDDELERVAQQYEQAGYAFRDTESKWLVEGLEWTYRRLAHEESIGSILNNLPTDRDPPIDRRTVEKAIERVRSRIGLTFP
jgi:hypothetical protein